MAWSANEVLTRPDMRFLMQKRGLEPVCTSKEFVFVAEAFLMVLSGRHSCLLNVSKAITLSIFLLRIDENLFKSPEDMLFGASWRATRGMLMDPVLLSNRC